MKIKTWLISLLTLAVIGCSPAHYEKQTSKKYNDITTKKNFTLEEITAANEFLINFPNTLPGAKSIDKYLTPEAEYCLVHIRQMHLTENRSIKRLEEVKKVQDNIYLILSYLVKNCSVNKIYAEGLTPKGADVDNFFAELIYTSQSPENLVYEIKKHNTDKWIPISTKDTKKLKETIGPGLYEEFLIFQKELEYDAVYRLATDTEKIEIMAAEDPNTLKEVDHMEDRLKRLGTFRGLIGRKKIFNAIHENRENSFLDIASKQNSPLVVVVYGAYHAWGGKLSCGNNYSLRGRGSICDNIAEWNSKNPDKRFSLIEIVPFGL